MSAPARCDECSTREAVYAMQYLGEEVPTFYRLGYHIRGFKLRRLCIECKERIQNDSYAPAVPEPLTDPFDKEPTP